MTAISLNVIDFKELNNSKENFTIDGEKDISDSNISYAINWQRSSKRSGSAKIKQMHEISGTTAKPYKQKGTGNARHGSRRSVQFVGGRTCFGPTPRSFEYSLPKKIAQRALADAIRIKFSNGDVIISQNSDYNAKTSYVKKALDANKIQSALFIYDKSNKDSQNLIKSVRNIKNVKALDIVALNVYDLLKYNSIILDKSLLENIKKIIS